ncbi:hypothetical protein F2P56_029428 [Juglans regia]|uniref:Protein FAR1-RELATED SEQUENCE n=1 Tax=Juglans regia TaxID=51240 RepID=A0A833TLZ0_JUGRE|nr:hypothetical protein F2P56_029428 [Juglans regia]
MTQKSERGDDQSIRYVTLGCARGGKARVKSFNVAAPRPTGKTDCKARINALKVDGKMRLTTVHNTHNHGLSPKKSRFFRCNREVSETVKRVLDTNDLAGIRMNKSFGSLVVGVGGFENLPFLEKDCRNYIDKARHLRLGAGGAGALRDYFLRMQYKDNGFFTSMDLSDDGRLKKVFWADPRSRAAYQYFGDVVTFDTTYLTNRYGMPFAPFVGVNHHGQSILLGAGLISSEDTETFTWLFQTWLQCMDGIPPKAIITDQDRAMKNAIAIVFPESRHRFCLWHILKKVLEKLGSYAAYKSGLKSHLMKSVYDTQTIEEFEKCWDGLLNTYDLHENVWLKSLYDERHHWVPVFLKEHFWVGMSTTQRSESSNAGFTTLDTNAGGSSKPVLSPNVVRGKGRPPSLRRASRMEKDMRKVKAKQKKAPVKGKRKQRDEGDTPLPDVCRNLFRLSDVDITSPRQMQPVRDSGTQLQETVIASQESIQFGLDGDQPVQHGFDGSQLEQLD